MKKNITKAILIMSARLFWAIIISCIFFTTLSAENTSAQSVKEVVISVAYNNTSLSNVFDDIERKTEFKFLYDKTNIESNSRRVTLEEKRATVAKILQEITRQTRVTFRQVNNSIAVRCPKATAKKNDKQTGTIKGKVTDAQTGETLPGTNVYLKDDATIGATADKEGNYTIKNVEAGSHTLAASFVGYKRVEKKIMVKVGKVFIVNFKMQIAKNKLNSVVVVGYGTQKKKDLTGSVKTVEGEEIHDIPFTTFDNALAGKVTGVQVTKSDGTPGGAVRIRVRGSTSLLGGNEPLYVIDGVPVQVNSNYIKPGFDVSSPVGNDVTGYGGVSAGMSTAFVNGLNSIGGLNINDIKSITVLKDASATAIYGSKAANGVVVITTKNGSKDMNPQITANYSTTLTKPELPNVLNGKQYRMLLSEAAKNDYDYRKKAGLTVPQNVDAIVNHPNSYFGNANTNWLGRVTRNTFSHNAQLSVSGGSSASKYYTSLSFKKTPGTVKGTDYQRITGNLNLENDIGDHLSFNTKLNLGYVTQNISNGVYQQAERARPDYTPYDSTGALTKVSQQGASYLGFLNPIGLLSATNLSKAFSLIGSVAAIYDFTPNLEFKSTVSLNRQNYNQRNYTPSTIAIGSTFGNVANNNGIGSRSNSQFSDWVLENTLTYKKSFNRKHRLNVVGGTSYETTKRNFFSITASGYPNDNVLNNLSSAVKPLLTKGNDPSKPQSYLLSFYARANYIFNNKYIFTFTGRADGSSKFGPDNKFGYFPSGGVSWRMSQENFLKDVKWINEMKLRGSYGITGTQSIGDQMYRTLYSPQSYGGTSALIPTQLGNSAIKWETTKQTDAGIDFSFFNDRLQGTFDYYRKDTDGALLSLPIAPSSTYSSLLQNTADIQNTGYEFSIQGDIIRTKNFKWNMSLNVSKYKSLVKKLNPNADLSQIGDLTGLEDGNTTLIEGKPLGIITGMKVTGIIKTKKQLQDYKNQLSAIGNIIFSNLSIGDPMFELDSTGYPNFDAILTDNAAPNFYGGFTENLLWKGFNLKMYFTFSQGGKLMWGDDVSSTHFVGTSNVNASILKRWTPENSNSNRPRLLLGDQILYNTSLSIYNSSYLKLRTLSMGYTFQHAAWMSNAGIATASVYASATNVFTITAYPGNDPETSNDPYSASGGYFDVSNYPTVKTVSLGLKITF